MYENEGLVYISRPFFPFCIIRLMKRVINDWNSTKKSVIFWIFSPSFSPPSRGGDNKISVFLALGSLAMPPSNPPSRFLVLRIWGWPLPRALKAEILKSCYRHREMAEKNVKKLNDFFSKFQSSITLLRSKIIKNGKNGLEI